MYEPKYYSEQLILGSGNTAVITGWSQRKTVRRRLNKDEFSVIGNLYSPTRGIDPLIRNLIANPQITKLVLIDATKEDRNSGAVKCLNDFFRNGVEESTTPSGKSVWKINSEITGYIDAEIPAGVLHQLRFGVEVFIVDSLPRAIAVIKELATQPHLRPWANEPMEFPKTDFTPTTLPGDAYGHLIKAKTIAEAYVKILHRIKTTGVIRPTGYSGNWQELINLTVVVSDEPEGFYFPDDNYLPIDRNYLENYTPSILDDAPYVEGVKYTYGQRLRSWFGTDQIEQVVYKLINEIDAASAVMSLWDVEDHERGGSPCLNHIWCRVVDNHLSLTALFRSNDMFAAWVANAMGLRALQTHIVNEINGRSKYSLQLGPLMTISQSAHIYDDTWEEVDSIIDKHYFLQRDYHDPVGNFLISVLGDKIVVQQTTPGSGEAVRTYSGRDPLRLIREISKANPGIRPDHIGYLGMELQKAKSEWYTYIQDR